MNKAFLDLLAEALSSDTTKEYQVSPAEQRQFVDLHDVSHFARRNMVENIMDLLRLSNLPTLLAGDPKPDGQTLIVEGACDGEHGFDINVKRGDDLVLYVSFAFTPTV